MIARLRVSPPPTGRALRLLVVAALALTALACAAGSGEQAEPGDGVDAAGAADATKAAVMATQPEILIPAPELADVELRNQNDESVGFEQLRGKPALLTFIYTRCPLPEMCPATTLRFQEVQKALSEEERARVRLVSVSFDPAYDTPEVLAEYGELWDVDTSFWSLLTGSDESIRAVASAYGVWYERAEDGNFRHPMYSLILFPDGALHQVLLGSTWDSKVVAGKLLAMASEPGPAH
jgi:protein SCO1/2